MLSDLMDKKGALVKRIRELAERNSDPANEWTSENESNWADLNKDYDDLSSRIERSMRAEELANKPRPLGEPVQDSDSPKGETWRDQQGHTIRALDKGESYVSELRRQGRVTGEPSELTAGAFIRAMAMGPQNDTERRALSEGTDSAGGATVPDVLMGEVVDGLRAASQVMVAGARTLALRSDTNKIAKLLTDPVAGWRAENAAVAASDPTFGVITLSPETLAVQIKISRELLQDTANLNEMLQKALSGALAAEVDRVVLRGSGASNQPLGLNGISGVNSVDMGTNGLAITDYDPFIDAIELIRTDNVMAPMTGAIMHPRTGGAIGKFADTTGQPLQRPAGIASLPFLQSTNVSIADSHGTANDASRIYLGDWTSVLVGVRSPLRIEVTKDTLLGTLQTLVVAWLRVDVAVTHAESLAMIEGVIP